MLSSEALGNLMEAAGMYIEIRPGDMVGLRAENAKFEARMFDGPRVIRQCSASSPDAAVVALLAAFPYPARDLAYFIAEVEAGGQLDAWMEKRWQNQEDEEAEE